MSTFTVETACGTAREFSERADAEEAKDTHRMLCEECSEDDIRVEVAQATPSGPSVQSNGGNETASGGDSVGTVTAGQTAETPAPETRPAESLPAEVPDSVQTDPLDVVPDYMIDFVDGQPAINKRGYAVIAERFDIAVKAEAITPAGETDHEYAEFKATAWRKEEGPENGYTGHATARASESRSNIADNLNEMAETRAMKRAVAWASGVGILAWEEVSDYVDE